MLVCLMLMLILLLHGDGGDCNLSTQPTKRPKDFFPERCKYLQTSGELMHMQCKGKFPLVAYTKFRDTYMKQTDRMALFMPASGRYVMAALKESNLHECDSIQLVDLHRYQCWHGIGGRRTVKLKTVKMFCFPFHIQLPDDLMHQCVLERDGVTDSDIEKMVLRTEWGIIHYTFDAAVPKRSSISLTLVLLAMLWFFCFFNE